MYDNISYMKNDQIILNSHNLKPSLGEDILLPVYRNRELVRRPYTVVYTTYGKKLCIPAKWSGLRKRIRTYYHIALSHVIYNQFVFAVVSAFVFYRARNRALREEREIYQQNQEFRSREIERFRKMQDKIDSINSNVVANELMSFINQERDCKK